MAAATPALHPPPATRTRPPRPLRRATQTPRLSVVVVNYRQWDETAALVRRLRDAACVRRGEVETVVVDNHSPPHPMCARVRRLAGVSLRRWGRNRGFARAVNEGTRLSRGRWLLLLNPDTSPGDDFLDAALALADRLTADEPRAGVVGFQLRNGDGSRQFSAGSFPTLASTLVGLFLPRARRKYRRVHGRRRRRVPWVTGCGLLLRRDCWQQLGGLDNDFFLYYEDVDLCRRARAAGWSVWYEPSLRLVHHSPLHTRAVPPHLRLVVRHGLLTYAAKHWPGWQLRLLAAIVRAEGWVRQRLAQWRGNDVAAHLAGEQVRLAAEVARRETRAARRRLDRAVRREERRRDV